MSATVLAFPARLTVHAAWNRYVALRQREMATPALMLDRDHAEQVSRAYRDWNALFLKSDQAE